MYQGQKAFSTDPKQLSTELQRQNAELEKEFGEIGRDRVKRWRVVRALGSAAKAEHGDMVLAGFNQNCRVLLPPSSEARAGLAVRVVQVGGTGAVTVAAQAGETVNALPDVAIGLNTGFRDYTDDGRRGWWGPAV